MAISKPGTVIEYEDWYLEMIGPIRQALYVDEQPDADRALALARERLAEFDLPEGTREVSRLVLRWYEFITALEWMDQVHREESYRKALVDFKAPVTTPGGEVQRIRLLLILRCTGQMYGLDTMARRELDVLLSGLDGAEEDEFLWHNIASWAFATGELDLLERAYEVMLIHPSNLLGQAKWQRVNIMLQLRNGRVTRRDVEETIKGMEVLPQILEFKRLFWPVCIELGLVDDELTKELELAYQRITAAPPVPRLERRTKNIRN